MANWWEQDYSELDFLKQPEPKRLPQRPFWETLKDNVVGIDDEYDTLGERFGRGAEGIAQGIATDPLGLLGGIAQGTVDELNTLMFEGGAEKNPELALLAVAGLPAGKAAMKAATKGAPEFLADESGSIGSKLSPAQQQAQDVIDMANAGRANEVTEEMMSRADDQYMWNNSGIPMDEASRMARAKEMGFDRDVFHGGAQGIESFDPEISTAKDYDTGTWTTTDRYNANRYSPGMFEKEGGGQVYPVALKDEGFGSTNFYGKPWGDGPEGASIDVDGVRNPISELREDWQSWASAPEAVRGARELGLSGLEIKNVQDYGDNFPHKDHMGLGDEVASSIAVMDPTRLRSKYARFDPRFKHLANLSAGVAGAIPLLQMLQNQNQDQTHPLLRFNPSSGA